MLHCLKSLVLLVGSCTVSIGHTEKLLLCKFILKLSVDYSRWNSRCTGSLPLGSLPVSFTVELQYILSHTLSK